MSRNRSKQLESPSYMEMRIDTEGKEGARFLRIPTFWDEVNQQHVGALKLSDGHLITCMGKDSYALQNAFLVEFHKIANDEKYAIELFDMFKPLEFWEKK